MIGRNLAAALALTCAMTPTPAAADPLTDAVRRDMPSSAGPGTERQGAAEARKAPQ